MLEMRDRVQLPFPTARVLVVSDFNCPYCYTLNEWVHKLGAGS
jgi:protein-disulfide isomerase